MKKNSNKKQGRKISLPSHYHKIQNKISIEEMREQFKRQLSLPKEKDILPINDPMQKVFILMLHLQI